MKKIDDKWQEAELRVFQISKEVKNRPTPADVLEDARSETSPLHYLFDWDDETAAENQRIDTARRILRRVKFEIVVNEKTIVAPGFFADPDTEYKEQGYVAHPVVKKDCGLAARVCFAEFDRARANLVRAITSAKSLDIECASAEKALGFLEKMIKSMTA